MAIGEQSTDGIPEEHSMASPKKGTVDGESMDKDVRSTSNILPFTPAGHKENDRPAS